MRKLEKGHFGSTVSDFSINPSRTLMTWSMMRAMKANEGNAIAVKRVSEEVQDKLGPPHVRPSFLSERHYAYLVLLHKQDNYKSSWMFAYFREGKYCIKLNEFVLMNQV